ncbi:MAG: ATP-binding protein [Actinomycetota bacterium]
MMAVLTALWTVARGGPYNFYVLAWIVGCCFGGLMPRILPWDRHPELVNWLHIGCATVVQAVFVPFWSDYPPHLICPAYGAIFVAATAKRHWILIQMAPAVVVLAVVTSADAGLRTAVADTLLYGVGWATVGLVSAWMRSVIDTTMAEMVTKEQEQLEIRHEEVQAIVDSLPLAISWKDTHGRFLGANTLAQSNLRTLDADSFIGRTMMELAPEDLVAGFRDFDALEQQAIARSKAITEELSLRNAALNGGNVITFRYTAAPYVVRGEQLGVVTTGEDVTETREMERALATQGRMESIGQLAAGVAHEINTPVQFVSDNTEFLSTSIEDLIGANQKLAELAAVHDGDAVARIQDEADIEFVSEEAPNAIGQCLEGLARVARIVRALKEFSHPGDDIEETDINKVITSTVDISSNEWKYVADLELELDDDLPPVPCSQGRLKQVVLNMIVNAAHAIEDADPGEGKGRITVATSLAGDHARISISDSGIGMEPHVKERIFDQFFTTKKVGRGTGQGLSLAWDVVQAHNGSISVDSTLGQGTTFNILLPLTAPKPDDDATDTAIDGVVESTPTMTVGDG